MKKDMLISLIENAVGSRVMVGVKLKKVRDLSYGRLVSLAWMLNIISDQEAEKY